jgi:hypothetical protein
MNVSEQIEIVREIVKNYFDENAGTTIGWLTLEKLSEDEKAHIINIGTSILCTKWQVGYPGGGFVQAFVDNDLMSAIGSADGTSYKGFKFFAQLMYNVGAPSTLFN